MYIYSAENIRQIDRETEKQGLSMLTLMENAGRNTFEAIKSFLRKEDSIVILAGRGNNGGDGIVIARYLKEDGFQVSLYFPLGMPKSTTAVEHLQFYHAQGFTTEKDFDDLAVPTVIIDALLGVGTSLPLRDEARKIIHWANKQRARRFAIDIPTGVHANDGKVNQPDDTFEADIFQADITFTLHGGKPSQFLLPAGDYYGKVIPITIGIKQTSKMKLITEESVCNKLPKREQAAHKGTFGTAFLIAGSDNMPGSALLAAIGSIRSGTGKLIIGTTPFTASIIASVVPEATYIPDALTNIHSLEKVPDKIAAIGIGPGLQDNKKVKNMLDILLYSTIPLVIDAGALLKDCHWKRKATTILTPHPGEFSRLTGISVRDIQSNRISLAKKYAVENQVILVLKGRYTVIALPDGDVYINPTGNAGLAKGGSGDVLTGMITSMVGYYENPAEAVKNAVFIHGLCAEIWAEKNSPLTMTASDFNSLLPIAFHRLEKRLATKHNDSLPKR